MTLPRRRLRALARPRGHAVVIADGYEAAAIDPPTQTDQKADLAALGTPTSEKRLFSEVTRDAPELFGFQLG